jgi:hypothetical protein
VPPHPLCHTLLLLLHRAFSSSCVPPSPTPPSHALPRSFVRRCRLTGPPPCSSVAVVFARSSFHTPVPSSSLQPHLRPPSSREPLVCPNPHLRSFSVREGDFIVLSLGFAVKISFKFLSPLLVSEISALIWRFRGTLVSQGLLIPSPGSRRSEVAIAILFISNLICLLPLGSLIY